MISTSVRHAKNIHMMIVSIKYNKYIFFHVRTKLQTFEYGMYMYVYINSNDVAADNHVFVRNHWKVTQLFVKSSIIPNALFVCLLILGVHKYVLLLNSRYYVKASVNCSRRRHYR